MLDELYVSNLGVIGEARIDLSPGMVVVTGETGAGKTLLLGALRLLLGETARKDRVGPAGDSLVVEARIVLDGEERNEQVVARRVTGAGRSKAYVDGTMVTAAALGELMGSRAEVVGQHDHVVLATPAGVRRLVDDALDDPTALDDYGEAWRALAALREEANALGGDRRALQREMETNRFQAEEITSAGFAHGDDTVLAATAERLRHHEAIVQHLAEASGALGEDGAGDPLARAAHALRRAARLDAALGALAEQADELVTLSAELATAAVDAAEATESDAATLEDVESRLALLGDLRRKYGATLDDVIEFGAAAERRADELGGLLERAERIDGDIEKAELRVGESAALLHAARRRTTDRLAAAAIGHLGDLGFARPVVEFVFEEVDPGPLGRDRLTLQFSSDEALPVGPVGRVASGGELSRLVLAIRLASGVADVPIVAFDEVDAGVGGATALALGRKLAALATGRQVLCVTHLPQVAAHADTHVVVDRDGPAATVRTVTGDARVAEISRMLAGAPDSDQGRAHARELLELAGRG